MQIWQNVNVHFAKYPLITTRVCVTPVELRAELCLKFSCTSAAPGLFAPPQPLFSDGPLCEALTSDLGGSRSLPACAPNKHASSCAAEGNRCRAIPFSSRDVFQKENMSSPRCWRSRCSKRIAGTLGLQCPTSGNECSSPQFLPHCFQWWVMYGQPRSSDFRHRYNQWIS